MNLIYLASPYSKYPYGRDKAFFRVCKKAGELMKQGLNIFCPIAHSHAIEKIAFDKAETGEFWLKQDFAVLENCDKLFVYKMPGWEDSLGVKAEIAYAETLEIPIEYIEYEEEPRELTPLDKVSATAMGNAS